MSVIFLKKGCKLLDEYKNTKTPITYRCECGNISKIKLSAFLGGMRCGCKRKSKQKIEDIAKEFEDKGCKLLETEFKSVTAKMKYICKCGEETTTTLTVFRSGCFCKKCGNAKISGENHYLYVNDREAYTLQNKFKDRCRKILRHTLNMIGKRKDGFTYDLLGYSPHDLQEHITNHPNWNRVKDVNWHLDHVWPIQAFVDNNIDDIKLINCLENLQPLTQEENNQKRDKYNKKDFLKWIAEKTK